MSEKMNSKDLRGPFTQPWFLVSAVIVGLILLLVVVYALLPPAGQSANPAPAQPVPTGTAQPSKDSAASVCGLPTGDQRLPGQGTETTWEIQGKAAVPTAPEMYGPGTVKDSSRTCFAHNPTGALYSAANFFGTSTVEEGGTVIMNDLVAPGPLRDKYLASPPPFSTGDQAVSVQIAGFQIQSYTDEAATVLLGIRNSNGGFGSQTVPLKWVDGDWKVDISSLAQMAPVDGLSSFIPWAGA